MDYEKKYNEALERAKKVKHAVENIGCSVAPDMLEVIFPELAESEDERIRKDIVFLIEHIPAMLEDRRKRCLDWLEKQKEQKPAEWSEEDERILKGVYGKIDHDQSYNVSKVDMLNWLESLRPQPKQESYQYEQQ